MISTRGNDSVTIDEAILRGLARDGGLYLPEQLPEYVIKQFYKKNNLIEFAANLLAPFFTDSRIKVDQSFCKKIFTFPLPIKTLDNQTYVLELFHGPTLSFKDFGARFFAQCLQQLIPDKQTKVLVATSGDTGSAVASAFHEKSGVDSFILFPKGKISLRQQAQITCWGKNIHAVAVNGTFDQCQQLVKKSFMESKFKEKLTTANSINIARLLPQVIFYAYSSIQLAKHHQESVNFIVPSGNMGNVTACYWAKKMGFPIDQILIATNANRVLTDFLSSGTYQARQSRRTLANAMDVGDPSNLERLLFMFNDFSEFKSQMNVESVSDESIKEAIITCYQKYDYLICPHTATAFHRLKTVNRNKPWIIMATAHPVKFNDILEPLLNIKIPIPEQLNKLLMKKEKYTVIEPIYEQFQQLLESD